MHRPLSLHSHSAGPWLRIGVLLDSCVQPAWVAEILQDISRSNFARVELVVLNAEPGKQRRGPITALLDALRDKALRRNLLFKIYARWERRKLKGDADPFRATDCGRFLGGAETLSVMPARAGFVHRLADADMYRLREKNLDVLLRFGFNVLRGEILASARCGVWSFHHGDHEFYRGGPAYFWELVEGNSICGAMLQVLTEELDAGKVLCRGFFATKKGLSWAQNRVQPYWGASGFMMQKLRQLHEQGWESLEAQAVRPVPYKGKQKIYRAPTNGQLVKWLAPALGRAAIGCFFRPLGRMRMTHWTLGVGRNANRGDGAPDANEVKWLRPPRGHFHADPFLFEYEGRRWLFFEDYDYAVRRAGIACAEVLADGELGPAIDVLKRPYHLSYPCVFRGVFREDEQVYMVPETRGNGTVELYRCVRFPDTWELVKTLIEAQAVDTTVWCEDGLYWFFVTLREPRGGGLQLWLFSVASVLGEWVSHPKNPISTDVRSSRGAGAIYRDGEKLIRPSQDCSGRYGRSFTLNEIEILTRNEFQERAVVTVEAPSGMVGTHTYARLGDMEVMDGCAELPFYRVMDWRSFWSRMRGRAS